MENFFDETTGSVDFDAFEKYLHQARLDAIGFSPGPAVPGRTLRVETQKSRFSRRNVSLVLDTKGDQEDAVGDLESIDVFSFVARDSSSRVLVYRSSDAGLRLLSGESKSFLNDENGTREITQKEIADAKRNTSATDCPSPFSEGAHLDDSTPGCSTYTLLIEHDGDTFSQEVYVFLARGDEDAIRQGAELIDTTTAHSALSEVRSLLYVTGSRVAHGQILLEFDSVRD